METTDMQNLKDFYSRIQELESLQQQGLLYRKDLVPLEKEIDDFLKENIDPDSIADRKIKKEKSITLWTEQTIDNTLPKDNKLLPRLRKLLEIYTESIGEEPLEREVQVSKGETATTRAYLYRIFSEANSLIEIQDGYIDQTIFYLLAPAIKGNPQIEIHLLTDPGRINQILTTEKDTFARQFPNVEIRCHRNNSHDRYVIIDNVKYYNLGASIKDLGDKSATITELTKDENIQKLRSDFDSWWNNAQPV